MSACSDAHQASCSDMGSGAGSDASSDAGEEVSYREAWSSKLSGSGTSPVAQAPALTGRAAELKQAGNAAFAAGQIILRLAESSLVV